MTEQAPDAQTFLTADEERTRLVIASLSLALERHLDEHAEVMPADLFMGLLNFTRTTLVWMSIHAKLQGNERLILFNVALQQLSTMMLREHERLIEAVDQRSN